MLGTIIEKIDANGCAQDDAMVHLGVIYAGADTKWVGDSDLIPAASIAKGNIKSPPALWYARFHSKLRTDQPESEDGFQTGSVQPARRTGVPRPAATTYVSGSCVNIGCDHVRLQLVRGRRHWILAVVDGAQYVEPFLGA